MISNSKSISKRPKTETNADHEKSSRTESDNLADSASIGSNTFSTVFTEDILPSILDNLEILTLEDLLTFRLVNRCWRDAATSVILKRNICVIELDFGKVALNDKGNEVGQYGGFRLNPDGTPVIQPTSYSAYKYFNVNTPTSFLSDLNQLISTSPKFPCDSFFFDTECTEGFGNLCPPSDFAVADPHQLDLFCFFSLYGKKIRRLAVTSGISKKAVQNLLYVHMPNLLYLDIKNFDYFLTEGEANKESEMQVCLPAPLKLKINELVLGYVSPEPPADKSNFVKDLISVSPNLSIIQDVHTSSLEVLLEMKKCHCVNKLQFDVPLPTSLQFRNFLTDSILRDKLWNVPRLQLSKLTVWFDSGNKSSHEYDALVKGMNLILSASKNSLKYLEFKIHASDRIADVYIPSLPQLNYLKLDNYDTSCPTRFHFFGDVISQALKSWKINLHQSADDFNALTFKTGVKHIIPSNYFPRLRKVKLYSREFRGSYGKLIKFFSMEFVFQELDEATTVPGDTLLTVTTLKVDKFGWGAENLSKLFPNISYLQIHCAFTKILRNWVWDAFPKLEKFELTGLPGSWDTKFVDSFFTGISAKLCAQFITDTTSKQLCGRRTKPYIGDCKNLKELKIGFDAKLTSKFVSEVTAVHGFQDVIHRTKIIFSFQNRFFCILNDKEIEETRQFLDPVAAYVEIQV